MKKLLTFILMSSCLLSHLPLLTANETANHESAELYEIIHLNTDNFKQVIDSPKPVIIDVYTDWCGPCKSLAPIFKELSNELGDRYQFVKFNAEEQPELSKFFQIRAYPTLIFIRDGKEVGRSLGYMNKAKLTLTIENKFKE